MRHLLLCLAVPLSATCAVPAPLPPLAAPAAAASELAAGRPAASDPAALGLRLAQGFTISQIADETLANDLFSMAISSRGEIAVSSKGWIKLLRDRDGDGKADDTTLVAETASGSMGLQFDGDDLYSSQDGGLVRLKVGADGRATAAPQRVLRSRFTEHGSHMVRRGPDGWLHYLAGNEAELDGKEVTHAGAPITRPLWGALVRLSPDLRTRETLADGFRNPYRFDFTAQGAAIVYDANGERDIFLPWYLPTRVFHAAHGGHHGWTMGGWQRSFARPDDYPDGVPILQRMGEGSPTGVVCYRHTLLPERWRRGCFFADWTFGRVSFVSLAPNGASFAAGAPQEVLASTGTDGFAPVDLAVAPDGAIVVAIGGRGTRGGVYRLGWAAAQVEAPPADPLQAVLRAPQPLDPWSRARWVPAARRLGPAPFVSAVGDDRAPIADRIRAVEVLVELWQGVAPDAATVQPAAVRARVAWALGRSPRPQGGAALLKLARDGDALVRVRALEALGDAYRDVEPEAAATAVLEGMGHQEQRLRHTAAWLASVVGPPTWERVQASSSGASTLVRLGVELARAWRLKDGREHGLAAGLPAQRMQTAEVALAALKGDDPAARGFAVRLLQLVAGDWKLHGAPAEAFVPYVAWSAVPAPLARKIIAATSAIPPGDPRLEEELARLWAMLAADDRRLPDRLTAGIGPKTDPVRDLHLLSALARLPSSGSPVVTKRVVDGLLGLHGKLGGGGQRVLQNWELRLTEVFRALLVRDRRLAAVLARHPELVRPQHLGLALALDGASRLVAARRLAVTLTGGTQPWSEPAVNLIAELPAAEAGPLLRAEHQRNEGLRDALLVALSRRPEDGDRARYLAGLSSFQPSTVNACLEALERLPPLAGVETEVALLGLLRRLTGDPAARVSRTRVVTLLGRATGERAVPDEGPARTREALQLVYQPLIAAFVRRHPGAAGRLADPADQDPAAVQARLRQVSWDKGDARRGEAVATARACITCHGGARSLGPSLAGAATRMSREDLFSAIAFPNRDVSAAYRGVVVQTRSGETYTGMTVYDSSDVVMLRTGPNTTVRLAGGDIASRRPAEASLMPAGLLEGLGPVELADMYSYLRTLK